VQLTPVAIREGRAFADTVFGNQRGNSPDDGRGACLVEEAFESGG
jgi:hypothetical protein